MGGPWMPMAGAGAVPAIEEALRAAAQEGRQLYLGTRVPCLAEPPSPTAFLRDWVGPRRPCVVRGALEEWDCVKDGRWGRPAYLREKLAGRTVTISLTPDGRADAVRRFAGDGAGGVAPPGAAGAGSREYFVLPDDHQLEIGAFLDHLREGGEGGGEAGGLVAYAQCQNGSLTGEFRDLLDDAASDVGFASAAFGGAPERGGKSRSDCARTPPLASYRFLPAGLAFAMNVLAGPPLVTGGPWPARGPLARRPRLSSRRRPRLPPPPARRSPGCRA